MCVLQYIVVASNDKSYAAAENFYEDLGDIAMDKGLEKQCPFLTDS